MRKVLNNKIVIFTLIAPGVLIFCLAIVIPIILSVYLGMTHTASGVNEIRYIGLKNYIEILTTDTTFWKSLLHSIILGLCYVIIQHPICIVFAILIDKISGKREKLFRTIFFLPCVISIVITTKMWVTLFNPEFGLINKVLSIIGLGYLKQNWLGDYKTALYSTLMILIWQGFGWGLMIYYAGLKGISEEFYEAAKIDGATNIKMYTYITLPLLVPIIRINVTLAMINALKQMETVYIATNGGPGDTTQFLGNYLYYQAFFRDQYGYGNAISVLFVIICALITIFLNKILRSSNA